MRTEQKNNYNAPEVEVVVMAVEQGCAVSSTLEDPTVGDTEEWQ